MKYKLLVIGKNSRVFARFSSEINDAFYVTAISHRDIQFLGETETFDIVWVLSTSRDIKACDEMFVAIGNKNLTGKVVLMSSAVAALPTQYEFYSYVRNKKEIERRFLHILRGGVIVRSGTIVEKEPHPVGTHISNLLEKLCQLASHELPIVSVAFTNSSNWEPSKIYKVLFSMGFLSICRIFDLWYSLTGKLNYGYTYALSTVSCSEDVSK